jgi:hypothetical protein
VVRCGLDSSDIIGLLGGFCEQGIELLGYIKGGKFLD